MAKQAKSKEIIEVLEDLKFSLETSKEYVHLKKETAKKCFHLLQILKETAEHIEGEAQRTKTDTRNPLLNFLLGTKKKRLCVYMPNSTSFSVSFKEEFTKRMDKLQIACEFLTRKEQLKDDAPLIVVCPVSTRIESDLEFVLNQLTWPHRFAVAVVSIKREDSLPRLPIESRLNTTKEEYKNMEFIDIAFTMEELIYNCKMNTEANEKIKQFVNEYQK